VATEDAVVGVSAVADGNVETAETEGGALKGALKRALNELGPVIGAAENEETLALWLPKPPNMLGAGIAIVISVADGAVVKDG